MSINPSRLSDQLGNGDVTRVSTTAFAIINAVQKADDRALLPGEQVAAIVAAFVLTMEASRMGAPDTIAAVRNLMADANGRRPEFKAISDYLKKEVLR